MKGNARSSGYVRNTNDYYVEPPHAVSALLRTEGFSGAIHDPACGGGNIPRTAAAAGFTSTGADLVDRGFGEVRDFLQDAGRYENVVTNPPFDLAVAFTLKALELASGKVAVLQRLSWLEGAARHDSLFQPGYLRRVWVFSKRISMPPGGVDVPAKGGAVAFAWFVFERGGDGSPAALGWLR